LEKCKGSLGKTHAVGVGEMQRKPWKNTCRWCGPNIPHIASDDEETELFGGRQSSDGWTPQKLAQDPGCAILAKEANQKALGRNVCTEFASTCVNFCSAWIPRHSMHGWPHAYRTRERRG